MKRILTISIAAIMLLSCSSNQFKIDGNIEGATDQMVYLLTVVDNDLTAIDSTMMKQGNFTFTGTASIPDLHAIEFEIQHERLVLFLDNSNVKIRGSVEDIMSSDIEGSPTHDLFVEFSEFQQEISQKLMEINFQFQSAAMEGSLTPELEQELRSEFMTENEKVTAKVTEFVKENSHSVVSAYITLSQLANSIDVSELEEIVKAFPQAISKSPYVEALAEKLETDKLTAIGGQFIDFSQTDPDGNMLTLSDYTGSDYVLLEFWAGWCTPCRRENPNLVKVYNEFKDKGFEIFAVSLDRSEQEWLDAIKDDGLTWPQVSDVNGWENAAAKMYGIQSIPANILISPEGKIIAKNLKSDELGEKLAEFLN